MQSQDHYIAEINKQTLISKLPRASPRLKLRIVGLNNSGFIPDAEEEKKTTEAIEMSVSSGRGPAPLPRNSGSHSSSDEDPP